ncbi:hypothetical protein NC653_041200 [Populus alba x Populus x berolinensis]|uniref:Uncharacterized protein n=1 Tax=Populus alba x Populus x berolinensis TaxID=444605 RepID=A0AAD6PNP4_9ROSI|nr:hypothetical protein NC653_041200 [Populus alba x Populus x berolinensis]
MDFHSLSRKELQDLCKKNKIPANMTNIAMADALKVLDKVEGREEFTNVPEPEPQQSPEKAMSGSPKVPQASVRTLIRRKPLRIEPESSKPLTRTRCTTRGTVVGEGDQENKTANLSETPIMLSRRIRTSTASARHKMESKSMESVENQEKNNVPKTPAARSSRRRAPAVSARGKVEAQNEEKSVQRVYSTRHSVRLLEKGMEGLGLKEKERVRPLKMDGLCWEIEDVETKDETEVVACQNLDHLLEERREIKRELQEESNNDEYEVEDSNAKQEMGQKGVYSKVVSLDNESEMNNELEENDKRNDYEMDRYNPKSEGLNGQDESNPIIVESSEKALPVTQELIYNNDSPTVVSEFLEDKRHDNNDLQSNFAIVGESVSNQSDEAKENRNAERVVEDASNQMSESIHETESLSLIGSFSTNHLVTGNLVAPSKDISVEYNDEALVEIDVMEAGELDLISHKCRPSWVSRETPGSINQTTSCTLASDYASSEIPLHKVHEHSSSETSIDITVMSQEKFALAAAPAAGSPTSKREIYQPWVAGGAISGQTTCLLPFAADTLQGQFPRPSELTTRKSYASEINKENIDDNGKEVEPKKENAYNKAIDEKISDELSLRQLRKMMREKLQMANNTFSGECYNDTKVLS